MRRACGAVDVGADDLVLALARMRWLFQDGCGQQAKLDVFLTHPSHEARGALAEGDMQGGPLIHGHEQLPLRVHVVERRRREDMAIAATVAERVHLAGADPVALRQHAALGKAGRSGRVLDVEQIVVLDVRRLELGPVLRQKRVKGKAARGGFAGYNNAIGRKRALAARYHPVDGFEAGSSATTKFDWLLPVTNAISRSLYVLFTGTITAPMVPSASQVSGKAALFGSITAT